MAIKRRSNLEQPIATHQPQEERINIVPSEKKPLPESALLADLYGEAPSPASVRRALHVAQACGDAPSKAPLSVADLLRGVRTPYDPNSTQEMRYRARVRNRGTAITAMCICCTGSRKLVAECMATDCPLWAYRLGNDPFYKRRT